ncbi:hypothetical protein J577_0852 [Acinetobacter sp. 263903-1]|nr:hypothetical protein J577_0852 [Acinetobacter sp. 263903-1]
MTTAKNDSNTSNTHASTQHDHQQDSSVINNVMEKVDQIKEKAQDSLEKINKDAAEHGGVTNMVKDKVTHMMDNAGGQTNSKGKSGYDTSAGKKSRFSPTVKGVMIGAVAGSVLPVFGTFTGAIIGGIAGKMYDRRCKMKLSHS